MIKQKKCFGQGLAKGHGCGKLTNVENRVYGLGKMCGCYSDWLLNSENGKIKMQKSIFKVQKPRKELEAYEREHKDKNALKTAHINTRMQVHTAVRKRDIGMPCISCGANWDQSFQAGHFYKSETFTTLKYHLDNIHGQCQKCNLFMDGNFDNYSLRLPSRIGQERYNALVELASIDKHQQKVWTLESLKEVRKNLKS